MGFPLVVKSTRDAVYFTAAFGMKSLYRVLLRSIEVRVAAEP